VRERMIELIRTGQIKPGQRLPPEHELMRQFNVGRSSVREAVHGLVTMGVLAARPRHGTIVISPVPSTLGERLLDTTAFWAVRDLFEVRLLLEEHAAAVAARIAGPDDVATIRTAGEAFEACVREGRSSYEANLRFHLAIANAAGNPVLLDCLRGIIGNLREMRERVNRVRADMHLRDIEEHAAITEAIAWRDGPSARRAMRYHIEVYMDAIELAARTRDDDVAERDGVPDDRD
jgi:GntR family transcriptional regulator, transcriptional repressor for pyruvate dehydrogenase complex